MRSSYFWLSFLYHTANHTQAAMRHASIFRNWIINTRQLGEHHIIHPVGLCDGRCCPVVRTEYTLYEATVEEITDNQSNNAQCK